MPPSVPPPQQDTWPLRIGPGIQRDGTAFASNVWRDGLWARFQRGRPRSIGGYSYLAQGWTGISRGVYADSGGGVTTVHSGSGTNLQVAQVFPPLGAGGIEDRTPAGFVPSANNLWQFDAMFNAGGTNTALIAHAAPNLLNISNTTPGAVYYGDITQTTALQPIGQSVDGGVAVLPPYLFIFGSFGYIAWSDANTPTNFSTGDAGSARICEGKILKGLISRGGFYSPAGLFWTQSSLMRATFIGAPAIFRFDTISDQTTILSSQGIIEYDGMFFWAGVDRFLMFNGTVQEVPNDKNLNWFFDNLNFAYRQKVWATKVPRYGEIWWFYPRGNATECTDAIIYNVREKIWYDAGQALGAQRSAGYFAQAYPSPVWMDWNPDVNGVYTLYQHEVGTDWLPPPDVSPSGSLAIPSAIQTPPISWNSAGPAGQGWAGQDNWMELEGIEPDFIASAPMTLTTIGQEYAQGALDTINPSSPYSFTPTTQRVDVRESHRQFTLRFGMNQAGGAWQMGEPQLRWKLGQKRR